MLARPVGARPMIGRAARADDTCEPPRAEPELMTRIARDRKAGADPSRDGPLKPAGAAPP